MVWCPTWSKNIGRTLTCTLYNVCTLYATYQLKFSIFYTLFPIKIIDSSQWLLSALEMQVYYNLFNLWISSTGSTIRNWDKVKTWLDQIFWQIYQKLMSSGFLSCGSLCLIPYFNFFWPHAASTASDRKGAKIQHNFSWFCQKNFFSKRQNKVIVVLKLINSRTKMTLQSSVVIFQALETSPASLTSVASASLVASTASKVKFPQETSWTWWSDHHWYQNNHYW